ncbi:PREDICTED: uncharacterized protein LOC104609628 [Nelumbo nucifera]|uniref:Uncharacterized protein LOC104609628 n=1 Tax=Nelumbo nucifera TaxID=4432 RepID=A0A1U8Q997_NELNU|nr:PREDICTED: uncharacterized protein LOC104609628 [Nelumbo nucifera]
MRLHHWCRFKCSNWSISPPRPSICWSEGRERKGDSEAIRMRKLYRHGRMVDLQASSHGFTLRKLVQSFVFGLLEALLVLGRAFRLYRAILLFPLSVNNVSISDTSVV